MNLREIDLAWVEETLVSPTTVTRDPRDGALQRSFRAIEAAAGRVLRVVHRRDGDDIVVVTAFFDRGAKP